MKQALLLVVLMVACWGCRPVGPSPVAGVVKLDGKPLANASVQFLPVGEGRDATATTNAAGEFVMSTIDPRDGVFPGKYKVLIAPLPAAPEGGPKPMSIDEAMAAAAAAPPPLDTDFPQKYTLPSVTPLSVEVPVVNGRVSFELESK